MSRRVPQRSWRLICRSNVQLDELRGRVRGVPRVSLGKAPGQKKSNVINPLQPQGADKLEEDAEYPFSDYQDSEEDNMVDLD